VNDSVQDVQNSEQPIKARVWRLSSCGVWWV
jgi:hypothetical protein